MPSLAALIKKHDIDAIASALSKQPELARTPNTAGYTPLMQAAKIKHPHTESVISALLPASKSTINTPDPSGNTPLHLAARVIQNPAVIQILLNNNADPTQENSSGDSPLDLAAQSTKPNAMTIIPILEEAYGATLIQTIRPSTAKPPTTTPAKQKSSKQKGKSPASGTCTVSITKPSFDQLLKSTITISKVNEKTILMQIIEQLLKAPRLAAYVLEYGEFIAHLLKLIDPTYPHANIKTQHTTLMLFAILFQEKKQRPEHQQLDCTKHIIGHIAALICATDEPILHQHGICALASISFDWDLGLCQITDNHPDIIPKFVAISESQPRFMHHLIGLMANLTTQKSNAEKLTADTELMHRFIASIQRALSTSSNHESTEDMANFTAELYMGLVMHCPKLTLITFAKIPSALSTLNRLLTSSIPRKALQTFLLLIDNTNKATTAEEAGQPMEKIRARNLNEFFRMDKSTQTLEAITSHLLNITAHTQLAAKVFLVLAEAPDILTHLIIRLQSGKLMYNAIAACKTMEPCDEYYVLLNFINDTAFQEEDQEALVYASTMP